MDEYWNISWDCSIKCSIKGFILNFNKWDIVAALDMTVLKLRWVSDINNGHVWKDFCTINVLNGV